MAQHAGKRPRKFAEFLDTNVGVTDPCCQDLDKDILILQFRVNEDGGLFEGLFFAF
jgi:hypothetical protein